MIARRPLLVALALAALTVAAWLPVLDNGFVNYDDDLYITDRPEVRDGLTGEGVVWAFTSVQGANWFPLTRLSWLVDAELFGLSPRAFHATSLVLHAANAALLLLALAQLTGSLWASAFVAAVFALHPLHVESVAWAASRKDVVSGLFFVLALLAYACFTRDTESKGRKRRMGLVLAALALGLMAKPMLVTLPFVLLLLDAWPLGRLGGSADGRLFEPALVRGALREKLPLFVVAALACAVTFAAQRAGGTVQGLEHYPFAGRVANAVDAYAIYLARAFWPGGLAAFYPYPREALPAWRLVLEAALLVALCAGTLREIRRRPYLAVGWYWFVGMLVPVIGLVQIGQAARADRYTYLPLIGLALMVAFGARELLARRPGLRAPVWVAAAAALGLLGAASVAQVRTWRSSESLFEHALEVTRDNHVAHINLGLALHEAGRLEEADAHLSAAVRLAPGSPHAWGLRGELRARQERFDEAIRHFQAAVELDPDEVRWRSGLARALLADERAEEAEESWRRVIALEPRAAYAHASLGLALFRQQRVDEAIASYRRALELEAELREALGVGGVALAHAQLGQALASRGDPAAARRHMDEAIRIDPENGELRAIRGGLFEMRGLQRETLEEYREALRLGHRSPLVLNNLAWLLVSADDRALRSPPEAVAFAREAAEKTDGQNPEILDTLAVAFAEADRPAQAAAVARRAVNVARAQGRSDLLRDLELRALTYEQRSRARPGH